MQAHSIECLTVPRSSELVAAAPGAAAGYTSA